MHSSSELLPNATRFRNEKCNWRWPLWWWWWCTLQRIVVVKVLCDAGLEDCIRGESCSSSGHPSHANNAWVKRFVDHAYWSYQNVRKFWFQSPGKVMLFLLHYFPAIVFWSHYSWQYARRAQTLTYKVSGGNRGWSTCRWCSCLSPEQVHSRFRRCRSYSKRNNSPSSGRKAFGHHTGQRTWSFSAFFSSSLWKIPTFGEVITKWLRGRPEWRNSTFRSCRFSVTM